MDIPPVRGRPPADYLLAYALADAARRARLGQRRRKQHARKSSSRKQDPQLSPTQRKGLDFEDQALELLARAGLQLLARNLRAAPGEIDLVMRDGDTLVLVEVRARSNASHGGAGASIGAIKQQRIIFAARHYLLRLASPPPCRFDVVLVETSVQWLKAAFDAQ